MIEDDRGYVPFKEIAEIVGDEIASKLVEKLAGRTYRIPKWYGVNFRESYLFRKEELDAMTLMEAAKSIGCSFSTFRRLKEEEKNRADSAGE